MKLANYLMPLTLVCALWCFLPPIVNATPDEITYAGGIITITGTSETSCLDIWNADQTNGWNVVQQTGTCDDMQFDFGAMVYIGNSTHEGHFGDSDVNLMFNSSVLTMNFRVVNGSLRFGVLMDASTKRTKDGVNLISHAGLQVRIESGQTANIYDSHLSYVGANPEGMLLNYGTLQLYESTLTDVVLNFQASAIANDVYRLTIKDAMHGLLNAEGTFNDVLIHSTSYAVFTATTFETNITNLKARNNTYALRLSSISTDKYLIDPDVDVWGLEWLGSSTSAVYRQYRFDLRVTYPNGTNVNGSSTGARIIIQHYGANAGVDYNATLGDDGTIPIQTLTMGFYNQTGDNTIYDYNPYSLTITNMTGYAYANNFTLNQKTNWILAVQQSGTQEESFIEGLAIGCVFMLIVGCIAFAVKLKGR